MIIIHITARWKSCMYLKLCKISSFNAIPLKYPERCLASLNPKNLNGARFIGDWTEKVGELSLSGGKCLNMVDKGWKIIVFNNYHYKDKFVLRYQSKNENWYSKKPLLVWAACKISVFLKIAPKRMAVRFVAFNS